MRCGPESRKTLIAGGAILVLLTLVVYLPAIHGGFIWDDDAYLTMNARLDSVDGLRQIWLDPKATPQYYPAVFTSFWLEKHLWGLNPLGYHLINVLLHAGNALLLWLILRSLDLPGAWLAAALFALHPVHVESVAWITERKNVLSGLGYLGSGLAYLAFLRSHSRVGALGRRLALYCLAFVLFAVALLAKTVTSTLPAAILLVLWWRRGKISLQEVLPLVPFFLLGAGLGIHTAYLEKASVGAVGSEWDLGVVQRVLIAGRALWFYAAKLIWPHPLLFNYPRWQVDPRIWWWYLYPVAAVALIVWLWRLRGSLGRGALAAVLFFVGTLLPAIGFLDIYPMRYSFVADHFQYLASIGLITLSAAAVAKGVARLQGCLAGGGFETRILLASAIPLILLGTATWHQANVYRDEESIWRHTLLWNPSSAIAHANLGNLLRSRRELSEAAEHFREAIRLKPEDREGYNGMGNVLLDLGKAGEALAFFRRASELSAPDANIFFNIGVALEVLGRDQEAEISYRRALEQDRYHKGANLQLVRLIMRTRSLEREDRQ